MIFFRTLQTKLFGAAFILIAGLCAALRVEALRLEQQRHRTTEIALQASNAVAERDSTHNVALESKTIAKMLGDSLRLTERRIVQIAQTADALDRAVNRERAARYSLSVSLDSLRQSSSAVVVASDGDVRTATFNLRKVPFAIDAEVVLPPPPDRGSIVMTVAVDPLDLEARVECSAADRNGVRQASLMTSSPPWATVRFTHLEQAPEVCAAAKPGPSRRGWHIEMAPVVGLGSVLSPRRTLVPGLIFGMTILVRR